jgi:hypothetical protein
MTENNQNKNLGDLINPGDADQDNGGGAFLSKDDVLIVNEEEDTTPLYDLVSTEPEDQEED